MMRLFVIGMLLLPLATAKGQPVEVLQRFDEANTLFRDGRYSSAADAFEAVLDTGYESATLHYNLGNTYYRLDELGLAILHYEKALRLNPEMPELRHSLTLARSRTVDQLSRLPDPFWKPILSRMDRFATPARYFWVGFIFYFAASILLALRILRVLGGDWLRRILVVVVGIATILFISAFSVSLYQASNVRYVLIEDQAEVFAEPDDLADLEARIHEGLVFDYLGEEDGWMNVRLPNGVTGWVMNAAARRI